MFAKVNERTRSKKESAITASTVEQPDHSKFQGINELVLVCGHAIYNPRPLTIDDPVDTASPHAESNWLLRDFQKSTPTKVGEHETFLKHIRAGVEALRRPNTFLIFSGGHTWEDVDLYESSSYLHALRAAQMLPEEYFHGYEWHRHRMPERRICCERYATDSYQNLLLSLLEFYCEVGKWPDMVTVITHAFKEKRFLECHAKALRWPLDRIRVLGINPPFAEEELAQVERFEARTRDDFLKDPYGCGTKLASKRLERGWDPDYDVQDLVEGIPPNVPQAAETKAMLYRLLDWEGDRTTSTISFPFPLPWDRTHSPQQP